jgi:hypothetical protein
MVSPLVYCRAQNAANARNGKLRLKIPNKSMSYGESEKLFRIADAN